ncbi:hypothetical protein DFH06DRAFT_1151897 [Mycena polygramma]|nr:hypothetical protein DFH06DRAFT_1151897 [Mycena polygramma]
MTLARREDSFWHTGSDTNSFTNTNHLLYGPSGFFTGLRHHLTSVGRSIACSQTLYPLFRTLRGAHSRLPGGARSVRGGNQIWPHSSLVPYGQLKDGPHMARTVRKAKGRQAVKVYRRQWDPPKEPRAAVSEGDDASTTYGYEAGERSTSPDTAVAHAALTTMYRMSTILHGARVPLSLAEIEGYESSGAEASDASPSAAAAERRAELAARLAVLKAARNARIAAAAAKNGDFEAGADAWMDRERAARMKIHVETRGRSPIQGVCWG